MTNTGGVCSTRVALVPETVQVGPTFYVVALRGGLTNDTGEALLGMASPSERTIYLEENQTWPSLWVALVHEIVHLILEQAGHGGADEGLVTALAYGILGVWPPEVLFG